MLINLGVGLTQKKAATTTADGDAMDVNGEEEEAAETGEGEGNAEEDMYSHKALLSTIVEELEERLSDEDIMNIFRIMNENLGDGQ